MRIPLSRPDITELEREKVMEVLNTPNLSLGPKLGEFEEKFAEYVGSRYAVAVNSGTSGLHLCIKSLGIVEGDEVITTPFSFVASSNCILFERAKPVFVDIDEKTLNIDVSKLKPNIKESKAKGLSLKAILPVHIFGRPGELDEIMNLADSYDLRVIEDACEAVGAEYLTRKSRVKNNKSVYEDLEQKAEADERWEKVGTFGDCGVFAFYPNKQITTGEGGIIVTDDEDIFRLCRSLRNQGRSDDGRWLQHERLGFNYRISELNCALGIAQLERIDEILIRREKVARLYIERFKEIEELIVPQFEPNKRISWFVYVVRLSDNYSKKDRDSILSKLKEKGIGCSNYFSPIHLQPFYGKTFGFKRGDFPIAEKVSERTIALPFYNNLNEEQIDYVCYNLKRIIQSI